MKVNFFMMEFIGFVSTFATLLVFTVANDHESISISPTTPEVVHYINDSHIALCNFPEGTKAQWISPKGMLITKTKGRVHIEEKASGKLALVFEHIALEDKDDWTCAQIDGEGQKSFKMVINQPITFVDTSTLQIAKEGANAVIRCEVKGDPEPTVSWSFNGEAIFLPDSRYTRLADGLSIKKVSRNDSGEYTCRAFQVSENMNNMDQRVILLKIKHKPEGRPKSIQYGFINGVVNLTCEALAEPQAHFKWSRPEKKIKDLSKYYPVHVGNHSSSLQVTISNATLFGTYKCNASNGIGWIEKTITLQEGTKPDPPKDFHLRGKTSEMFDVSVNAARTSDVPNEMEINGFVFEAIPEQEYKSAGGRWDKARRWNFAFNSEATLLINNLAANTTYLVRLATKNLAGLSDWTKEKLFTTKPKELPMPTFSHQIRPAPLDLTVILSIVAVSSYLNFAARQTERSLNVLSRVL